MAPTAVVAPAVKEADDPETAPDVVDVVVVVSVTPLGCCDAATLECMGEWVFGTRAAPAAALVLKAAAAANALVGP